MTDDLESKSIEELDALLANPELLNQPPVETEEIQAEPEQVPAPPEPEAPAPAVEPEAAPEPEVDPIQDMLSGWEAERKAHAAKMELQTAHASRLAGEIGHLKQRLADAERRPVSDESGQPVSDEVLLRMSKLEGELRKRDRDSAVAAEVTAVTQRPELAAIQDELKEAAPAFAAEWTQALDTDDPESARLMTRRVLNAVVAEAERLKSVKERAARQERRAASIAQIEQAKRKAASSATAGAPTPQPQKTLSEMSTEELDKLLTSMTGG